MTGDLIFRHHAAHRTKQYIRDETAFPNPLNFDHVMTQTKTSIDNASEHTPNDYWNDKSEVLLSEEWNGTARFQNLEDTSGSTVDPHKSQYYTT